MEIGDGMNLHVEFEHDLDFTRANPTGLHCRRTEIDDQHAAPLEREELAGSLAEIGDGDTTCPRRFSYGSSDAWPSVCGE